ELPRCCILRGNAYIWMGRIPPQLMAHTCSVWLGYWVLLVPYSARLPLVIGLLSEIPCFARLGEALFFSHQKKVTKREGARQSRPCGYAAMLSKTGTPETRCAQTTRRAYRFLLRFSN
ncbi:MAG: hypothetical protein P8163_22190, partial [Candidatus Thiodiazotropha sp.]